MKNVFRMIAIAMMTVTVFSCEKAVEPEAEVATTLSFTADFLGTKTSFDEGWMTWEVGDEIAVCDGAIVEVVKLTADDIMEGGASAVINTKTLATDAKEYYAIFPASCAYKEVNKSELDTFLTDDGCIQISTGAKESDKSQTFKSYAIASKEGCHFLFLNVDAIVYFKTERTDIASVQFKSNGSGLVKSNTLIDTYTEKISHNGYNGSSSMVYKMNGDKEAYIPICAGITFYGGYTLTAYDSKDNVIGTISTSIPLRLEHGKYYTIKNFDSRLQAPLPEGALPGKFTINSDGDQVYFSKGNLRYTIATRTWSFFDKQFECGPFEYFEGQDSEISLFTWGFDANKSIIPDTEEYNNKESGELTQEEDWGSQIGDGKTWRTLSTAEWQYLFSCGDPTSPRYGLFKSPVTVCDNIDCVVIAPDDWDLYAYPLQSSYGTTASEDNPLTWEQAEAAGLVCLPAGGYRLENLIVDWGYGYYWSSTAYNSYLAYGVNFSNVSSEFLPDYTVTKDSGSSVRLVTDCK